MVISCLLVSPNPASALNAEAGRLCEGDYAAFERRARTWVNIHARIPSSLKSAVEDARRRGEDKSQSSEESNINTLRRGRGKRRLVGPGDDAENGRESKRRSRSGSPNAVRSSKPLAAAPDNALGIMDIDVDRIDSIAETPFATPRPSQGLVTQMSPPQLIKTTPRGPSLQLPPASQAIEYPTFTTLNTTFEHKPSPGLGTMPVIWDEGFLDDRSETSQQRSERLKLEERRMQAAGGDVRRYNTGTFGVRTGLFRL